MDIFSNKVYLLTELVIFLSCALCVSLAFIWHMKLQLRKGKEVANTQENVVSVLVETDQALKEKTVGLDGLLAQMDDQANVLDALRAFHLEQGANLDARAKNQLLLHIRELEESLESARAQVAQMKEQLELSRVDLLEAQNKASSVSTKDMLIEKLRTQQSKLSDDNYKLNKENHSLAIEVQRQQRLIRSLKDELKETQGDTSPQLEALKQAVVQLEAQLGRSETERVFLEEQFLELESNSEELNHSAEELTRLRKEYSMLDKYVAEEQANIPSSSTSAVYS